MSNKTLPTIGLMALMAACASAAMASTTIYSNDFTSGAGSEWSNSTTTSSPNGEAFLGQFGNGTTTLTLSGLAPHTSATVDFDLYIINSMDGNGPAGGGVDNWGLAENGNSLILTNFANYPGDTQAYPGPYPGASNPDQTGATAVNSLGYGGYGDSTYHLTYTFTDASPTLNLAFTSYQNQDIGDESWGLDNVVVTSGGVPSTVVPEPSAWAAFGVSGLGLMGLMLTARKRRSVRA